MIIWLYRGISYATVIIILQYTKVPNQHFVHLKLTLLYVGYISIKKNNG